MNSDWGKPRTPADSCRHQDEWFLCPIEANWPAPRVSFFLVRPDLLHDHVQLLVYLLYRTQDLRLVTACPNRLQVPDCRQQR